MVVVVGNATQHIPTPHGTVLAIPFVACWDLLCDALMRPRMVAIRRLFPQHALQMLLIQAAQMVQTFLADRANSSLSERIRLR